MKTVNLNLVGLDGNAFSLLGAFQKQARREGWTKEEITSVRDRAMSGGYDNLLRVLQEVCQPEEEEDGCPNCGATDVHEHSRECPNNEDLGKEDS